MTTLPIKMPTIRDRMHKTFDSIPEDITLNWSVKLYSLISLAMDYVDTIITECITYRFDDTKSAVREVRSLVAEYERFRSVAMSRDMVTEERERGEQFEGWQEEYLEDLYHGLKEEFAQYNFSTERLRLNIATQQALTLFDVVTTYAREIDGEIAKYGVWACECTLVQADVLKLIRVLPKFADKRIKSKPEARRIAASQILFALKRIAVNLNPEVDNSTALLPAGKRPRYTKDEDNKIREMFPSHSLSEIAATIGRSRPSVRYRCVKLGLLERRKVYYHTLPLVQQQWFMDNYPTLPNREIAKQTGMSDRSIRRIAGKLNLHKAYHPSYYANKAV